MPMPATRSRSTPRVTLECGCRWSRAPIHRAGSRHLSDLVVRNVGRLTTWQQPVVTGAALVIRDGIVAWIGADRDLQPIDGGIAELDAAGAPVLPGFVDSHT